MRPVPTPATRIERTRRHWYGWGVRRLLPLLLIVGCGGAAQKPAGTPPKTTVEVAEPATDEPVEEPEAPREIVAKPPAGYVEMTVAGVADTEGGPAVVLVDAARTVGVPVFIGGTEALSIQLRLRRQKYQRPLTHDLLDEMVKKLGGRIVSVRVDSIENNVFIGAVVVQRGKGTFEVDSRVSDALALAVGNEVPIYVAKGVVEKSGVDVGKLGIETA